ncbi:MAG: metallophosphoesterase family protein [Planctomycetes bacterium]|jgi:diadenosine tetraphosphatase ApaH/serine/threonine PP2A family protein phosphatase|nr:metallophosphoesterase family protein [Planctomycetota bacterium]
MRIGILGDIHANTEALTAVVKSMREDGVDVFVQVGDIVGYGPEPSECIDIVRELGCVTCLGNHDAAVLDLLDTSYFNNFARAAIHWTKPRLRPEDLKFLRGLQLVERRPPFTVVHGSLHMPDQFGYVISPVEAIDSLDQQDTQLCFVGHSHVPAIYLRRDDSPQDIHVVPHSEAEISYKGFDRILMNVGSVGQPRDEDPRAAYGLVDTDLGIANIKRVVYDIPGVQRKIRDAGLPDVLANRLALGV